MNICKFILCPYFNVGTNGYGCQKYQASNHCHLIQQFPNINFNPNQYSLSSELTIEQLKKVKEANVDFFTNDESYQKIIKFQQTNTDWYTENMFQVGSLD